MKSRRRRAAGSPAKRWSSTPGRRMTGTGMKNMRSLNTADREKRPDFRYILNLRFKDGGSFFVLFETMHLSAPNRLSDEEAACYSRHIKYRICSPKMRRRRQKTRIEMLFRSCCSCHGAGNTGGEKVMGKYDALARDIVKNVGGKEIQIKTNARSCHRSGHVLPGDSAEYAVCGGRTTL